MHHLSSAESELEKRGGGGAHSHHVGVGRWSSPLEERGDMGPHLELLT